MISLHLFIVQCSSSTKFAKLADVFCLACFCNDVKNKFLQLKIPSGINFRWFQEISIPTPWRGWEISKAQFSTGMFDANKNGISRGVGGGGEGGGGVVKSKTFCGRGMNIFFNNT